MTDLKEPNLEEKRMARAKDREEMEASAQEERSKRYRECNHTEILIRGLFLGTMWTAIGASATFIVLIFIASTLGYLCFSC